MRVYATTGFSLIRNLFVMNGSVFPSAICVALPCSLLSAAIKALINAGYLNFFESDNSILRDNQAWSGFSFLVGFLIVFRTSQAYNRFWDGCTATHQMRAEWFDSCCSLFAFCNHSKATPDSVASFKARAVRLFSMLHAAALAELEVLNTKQSEAVMEVDLTTAFNFDIIDPDGFDRDSLLALKYSTAKVELVFSWIQCLIVDSIDTGVLSIPPPILSRAFHEIANGMVAFHDAIKISYIPFPFPYAQTCDCLLCLHWLVVPFVTSQWVSEPIWAFIFVMIQVFIYWALNFIAIEIENPFGTDPNDLDGHRMQSEMNGHLMLLLKSATMTTPTLVSDNPALLLRNVENSKVPFGTFKKVWEALGEDAGHAEFPTLAGGTISARVADFTKAKVHKRKHARHRHLKLDRGWTIQSGLSQSEKHPEPRSSESSASSMPSGAQGAKQALRSTSNLLAENIELHVHGTWEAIPVGFSESVPRSPSPRTPQRRETFQSSGGVPAYRSSSQDSATFRSDISDLSVLPRGQLRPIVRHESPESPVTVRRSPQHVAGGHSLFASAAPPPRYDTV